MNMKRAGRKTGFFSTMMKSVVSIALLLIFNSCSSLNEENLHGLWILEEVSVDELEKSHSSEYIEFKRDHIFSLTTQKKDLFGFYKLSGNSLNFQSENNKWYNDTWNCSIIDEDVMILKGKGNYAKLNAYAGDMTRLNTRLIFRKVQKIASGEDFVKRITGRWDLYQIRDRGENLPDKLELEFIIDDQGNYRIVENSQTLEQGLASINARHHKIIFEGEKEAWKVWFFGNEMRMDHPAMGRQYRLRRSK